MTQVDGMDASGPVPPSHRIKVFARADGRQIRFIADTAECDGELVDVMHLGSEQEVDAVTRALGHILQSEVLAPDAGGWHALPEEVPAKVSLPDFLKRLFHAAQKAAWADPGLPGRVELDEAYQPPTALPDGLAAMIPALGPLDTAVAFPPPTQPCEIVPLPMKPRRTRAPRTWTRERDFALTEMILTGYGAKDIAADPRFQGVSEFAIYQEASRRGLSFRASPQVTIRGLPSSVLAVYDRAAAACHKTRERLVADWMIKAAADPARYGLTAI